MNVWIEQVIDLNAMYSIRQYEISDWLMFI